MTGQISSVWLHGFVRNCGFSFRHYLKGLEKRFVFLAEQPQLGKHRPEISEGYYSFPQYQHIVFYLINSDCIDIIGVLHKNMDILEYFTDFH